MLPYSNYSYFQWQLRGIGKAALTYEVEDDDRELLPYAYLDLDGRDDDKYTSTTKLSTTDLLGSILYCSSSFAAVAWPVCIYVHHFNDQILYLPFISIS